MNTEEEETQQQQHQKAISCTSSPFLHNAQNQPTEMQKPTEPTS
jgi:hypothetical protein